MWPEILFLEIVTIVGPGQWNVHCLGDFQQAAVGDSLVI